jgi:ABC-2 type transport system ATP-binding protein
VIEAPREALLAQYAIPAIEVEVDERQAEKLAAWSRGVQEEAWVTSIVLNGTIARVIVEDILTAKNNMVKSIAQNGLSLMRYEVVKPSLEDVFLKLVGQEEAKE